MAVLCVGGCVIFENLFFVFNCRTVKRNCKPFKKISFLKIKKFDF